MNKRITALLLCFVMVLTMLATAVPVMAATTTQIKLVPNKTEVQPGDEVEYSLYIGPVTDMANVSGYLQIPDDLTFVTGSGVIPADLKVKLNADDGLNFTERPVATSVPPFKFDAGDCGNLTHGGYTSTEDTLLLTFKCTVDTEASGSISAIGFDVEEFYHQDDDMTDIDYEIVSPTLTVTAAPKPATNITLDKSTMELYTGGTGTLTATVTPAGTTDTVVWSSSNEAVATVVDGTVTAVAPGTATITVKAGSKSATCIVTVTNAPCTHENKTPVSAQESTSCTEKGWDAYQTCDGCGKLFDAAGNEISEIPYRAPKAHTPGPAATEDTDQICTECRAVITPALGHIHANHLTPVAAVAATCTVDGNTAYYQCSCGKLFTDDAATTETTLEAVTIGALGHDHSGAWESDDVEHWKVCAREGCSERLDTAAHNPSDWTFIDDGHHDKKCTVCGKQVAHEACESTIKYDDAKHWHECIKCGNISGDKEDHSYAPRSEDNPNPDKCTGCGYVKSSIKVTVPEKTETETGSKNPTTGAADNGMIGIAAAVLVAAGAAYVGFKKRG